jgi:hypothetical protein
MRWQSTVLAAKQISASSRAAVKYDSLGASICGRELHCLEQRQRGNSQHGLDHKNLLLD